MTTKLTTQKKKFLRIGLFAFIAAALVYDVCFLSVISQHIVFFPSIPLKSAAKALAFVFSALLLVSPLFEDIEIGRQKGTLALTVASLFIFYGLFVYGLGPMLNAIAAADTQQDIAGTKMILHHKMSDDTYFIRTVDVPEDAFSRFYIPQTDYDTMPDDVRLHVTFRQSFFGMTVKDYSIYY
jgi:hypothetical protein